MLRALQPFNGGTLCGTAAEKIASRPEVFSPVTLVVPAIERICAERGKLKDAWIAAAALGLDAPLATNNRSDFRHIPRLRLSTI